MPVMTGERKDQEGHREPIFLTAAIKKVSPTAKPKPEDSKVPRLPGNPKGRRAAQEEEAGEGHKAEGMS